MKLPHLVSICASALLFFGLVAFRLVFPESAVGNSLCFVVSVLIGLLFSSALALSKNVSIGQVSPWGALVVISSLAIAIFLNYSLSLGLFAKSELTFGVFVIFAFAVLFMAYGWWALFAGTPESIARQTQGGELISIIGGLLVAIAFFVKWLLNL